MLRWPNPRRSAGRSARFRSRPAYLAAALILLVWLPSAGLALPASGGAVAALQCDSGGGSSDLADPNLNWGAVPGTLLDPACATTTVPSEETFANWGSVPKEESVVVIQIGGDTVVQLPEVLAQSAGEMGAALGTGEEAGRCVASSAGLDPSWENVNRWDQAVETASQQVLQETGVHVPANVIKSVMKIESGGNPTAGPAYGLLQVTSGAIGRYDLNRIAADPAYGIYAGVKELAFRYLDSGKRPWENVVVGYFSGHYDPNGASDSFSTDFDYQNRFKQFFDELERVQPDGRSCTTGSAVGVASIWGQKLFNGAEPPLSQDFGPTDFSRFVHPEWYSYALAYGFTEPGHTGLDVAIPVGTPLYAPMDGIIVCAGTDNGTGEDSCAAFLSAYGGRTSGRLQMKLPNGDMLILGHVNESLVTPGATVKAGQQIGISGGFNGDHVHVEYRVRDGGTSSGWRIVDPREPLDGVRVTPIGTAVTGMPGPPPAPAPEPPSPTVTPTPAPDGDGDGLSDEDENNVYGTDPNFPDTDVDLVSDFDEIMTYGTNPLLPDTDNDGLSDGDEIFTYLSDPLSDDGDGDGLPDYNEVMQHGTNPSNPDSDGDGFNDHDEVSSGSNPNDPQSFPGDTNGLDSDFDGLSDGEEAFYGADVLVQDTDGDGISDGDEVRVYQTHPAYPDTDDDGLTDGQEVYTYFTNPNDYDTDDDGTPDGVEVASGSDPFTPG